MKSGFTFIELLIVTIIIAVFLGLCAPKLRHAAKVQELNSFVRDVYYLVKYLQASSIAESKIYALNIDKDKLNLWASSKGKDSFLPLSGRFGKKYFLPEKAVLGTIPEDKSIIYFYPDSSIDKVTFLFSYPGEKRVSLTIQGVVGDVKIQ